MVSIIELTVYTLDGMILDLCVSMDLYGCDIEICDIGMKIVIWSGNYDKENSGFR